MSEFYKDVHVTIFCKSGELSKEDMMIYDAGASLVSTLNRTTQRMGIFQNLNASSYNA
jgi:hypothetical protein